jgi:intracellular septation protein A
MVFLSALGLGLSIFLNSENALFISYLLWISKYLVQSDLISKMMGSAASIVESFWQSSVLLYGLSLFLLLAGVLYIRSFPYKNKNLA